MSNEYLKDNERELKVLEYHLENNVWNRLQIVSNRLTTEKTPQLKKEYRLLHKHLILKNIVDYYKIIGEIDIREILSKYLKSEKLSEEDIELLKEYFWFSNYEDYILDLYYGKKELTTLDVKLAYYSTTFNEEDKKILNHINQQYKIFSNTNSDRIEYLRYVLSLNNIVINGKRVEELEKELENPLNLKQKLQIKQELLKRRKILENDKYSYRKYLRHSGEIEIRQILEKYNNKEQLSKEDIEIIKEYFKINNYLDNAIFEGSMEDFEDSYLGHCKNIYSARFSEEELIKLKKIGKLKKKS